MSNGLPSGEPFGVPAFAGMTVRQAGRGRNRPHPSPLPEGEGIYKKYGKSSGLRKAIC